MTSALPAAALAASALAVWLSTAPAGAQNEPRVDYLLQCQGCHLADGRGSPEHGVPDLRGILARYLALPEGREYVVRVPGASGSPLSDAELAAVVNWMAEAFGPQAIARTVPPLTAEFVARVRRPPLDRVEGIRERLLRAAPGAAAEAPGGYGEGLGATEAPGPVPSPRLPGR